MFSATFILSFALSSSALPPKLAALVDRARTDPAGTAAELKAHTKAYQVKDAWEPSQNPHPVGANQYPIVVTHGMGDSCFNPGMKSITEQAGTHAGVYSVCVPTGANEIEDTIAGFLVNMDKSVDIFAKAVRADPKLAKGFNAFGLSQGNNLIHGYQLKYNDPPVISFISICGINAGVAAFPNCGPSAPVIGSTCEVLAEVLGPAADLAIVQDVLFQANFFRDPKALKNASYIANNQLAQWNGEGKSFNATFKENFLKTNKSVWVKGNLDTVVWPRESEWWGTPDPAGPFKNAPIAMTATAWYQRDTFGLQSASKAAAMAFESFNGEHIRMTEKELYAWIDTYFH